MSSEKSFEISLIYECIGALDRETKYWSCLGIKGTILGEHVGVAKRLISEEIYKLAAADVTSIQQRMATEELLWSYRELQLEIAAHEERRLNSQNDKR